MGSDARNLEAAEVGAVVIADLVGEPLTARQAECFELIKRSLVEHGFPPTLREIGNAMGIGSTNGVNDHLKLLERKGVITRNPLLSRSISVVGSTTLIRDSVTTSRSDSETVVEGLCKENKKLRGEITRLQNRLTQANQVKAAQTGNIERLTGLLYEAKRELRSERRVQREAKPPVAQPEPAVPTGKLLAELERRGYSVRVEKLLVTPPEHYLFESKESPA